MKNFWIGFVSAWIILFLGLGVMTTFGLTPMSAIWMSERSILPSFLHWTTKQSVKQSASEQKNPLANDLSNALKAVPNYVGSCIMCHGTVKNNPFDWSRGMVPNPPDLGGKHVQGYSDSELFWIIKNGIHSSGMPSFGAMKDEDTWQVVVLIRQLAKLPPELEEALGDETPEE